MPYGNVLIFYGGIARIEKKSKKFNLLKQDKQNQIQ